MENNIEHIHSNDSDSGEVKKIKLSPLGYGIKLFAKWFGFTSLYSAFAFCPFCGHPGCPVGLGSASIVGAFFALVFNDWKILFLYIKNKLKKKNE